MRRKRGGRGYEEDEEEGVFLAPVAATRPQEGPAAGDVDADADGDDELCVSEKRGKCGEVRGRGAVGPGRQDALESGACGDHASLKYLGGW